MPEPKRLRRTCSLAARASLAVAAAAVWALPASPATAHTSKPHPFKEASIALENHRDARTTIFVGHDGEAYTHILGGTIRARFRLKAKVKLRHRIMGFVVTTGDPSNEDMLPDNVKGAEGQLDQRKLNRLTDFEMDTATALSTGIWGSSPTTPQDIIGRCNNTFSQLPESERPLAPIELTIHAGFSAAKRRRFDQAGEGWLAGSEGRPGIAHTTLPVTIICQGFRTATLPPPPPPRAGNTLHSVDLTVSQQGASCPKHVTVTAYANYRWPAKSRMRLALPGGRQKMRMVQTKKVTFAGKTFHRAEATFKYTLDPGQKTFKLTVDRGDKVHSESVEITCPAFKVTSAWLKYEVEDKTGCPKKVKETATYHTTRPGWVRHEIRMAGGLVVSSAKLTSKRVGGKYTATATRTLTVNEIDREFMADAIGQSANSGWMPLRIECPNSTGDLKTPPKRQSRKPAAAKPDLKTAPKTSDSARERARRAAEKRRKAREAAANAEKRRKAREARARAERLRKAKERRAMLKRRKEQAKTGEREPTRLKRRGQSGRKSANSGRARVMGLR